MRTRRTFVGALAVAVLVPIVPLGAAPAAAGPPPEPACLGSSASFDPFGRNVIVGTNQSETLNGTSGPDVIIGRGGKDEINGRGSDDLLCGDEDAGGADGNDTIHGNSGNDQMLGHVGNDKLFGDSDRDVLFGGLGDDLLNGGPNAQGVFDEASYFLSSDGINVNLKKGKATGEGTDELVGIEGATGSGENDKLLGNNRDNSFEPVGGVDTVKGFGGVDTLGYIFTSNNLLINMTGGTTHGDGFDSFSGFENVIGGDGNDYITGDDGANALLGNEGDDTIFGRSGDDIMLGFGGDDTLLGGVGVADFVSYSDLPNANVSINLAQNSATRFDGADTLEGVEMVEGSDQGDSIEGDNGPNFFFAEEGDDFVDGAGGSDLIFFLGATEGVDVDLSSASADGMGADDLYNIEHVVGSSFVDDIVGDAERNFLNGSGRSDRVVGAGNNDYISGGSGNDTLEGGPGNQDMVDFFQSRNGVDLDLGASPATASGEGSDELFGIEAASGSRKADDFEGNAAVNYFYGQKGADDLFGLGGGDHLDGGPQTDSLVGGPANDECFTKNESSSCEDFSKPDEHPLSSYSRRYKKAVAAARRYKRRYK